MNDSKILAPSLLSANFGNLEKAIKQIEDKGGEWVHIDVMDGIFVPQITYGQPVMKSIRPLTKLIFDAHLMTVHPENMIDSFVASGADYITFHQEATVHHHRLVERIHELGAKAGISIVPSTPVSALDSILPFVDLVLVMTVNPGFGGQKLIPLCVEKIAALAEIRNICGYNYKISVDGGINNETMPLVLNAGVDVVVSGSTFFSGDLKWPC